MTADRDHERETRLRGEREKELAGELAEAVRLLRDGHYDGQCSGHGSYPCLNCETTAFLARHPDDAGEDGT